MTPSRYHIARFAQAFGFYRKAQRMGDAASEMHLLREAESQLGAAIWGETENIEALSIEYWNLRKLVKERDELRTRLAACQDRLDQAHEERSRLLNTIPEENQELIAERAQVLARLEELAHNRDQIVHQAREVRRAYVGLKMKLEVFTEESADASASPEAIDAVKARLVELKAQFAGLKEQRIQIGREIEAGDAEVDLVDEKISEKRQGQRTQASQAFEVIGNGNKEISLLRAELSVINTRMRQLYAEIGRYVSRNVGREPACTAAVAKQRGLVDVMRALRRSIALNHRLAGNA